MQLSLRNMKLEKIGCNHEIKCTQKWTQMRDEMENCIENFIINLNS